VESLSSDDDEDVDAVDDMMDDAYAEFQYEQLGACIY